MRGVLLLLATAVLAWLALAGPAALLGGSGPEVTVPALLACLAPNLLAVIVVRLVHAKSPVAQTGVVLASFLLRPLVALGLGIAVYVALPQLHGRAVPLLLWGILFYLIMLAAESYVVSRPVADSTTSR